MANNYSHFAMVIPDLTDEQLRWVTQFLKPYEEVFPVGVEDVVAETEWASTHGLSLEDSLEDFPDFYWEHIDGDLYFSAEEQFNADHVVAFLQAFLKRFCPDECFNLSYADTCSSARPEGFGGGAIFITVDRAEYMHTFTWLDEKYKAFRKATKRGVTMKLRCPNNCANKQFRVTATVSEDWLVDDAGDFVERKAFIEVDCPPDERSYFSCATCHEEAVKLPDPPQSESGTLGGLPTTNYTRD